jgi:hypothetical protein
MKKIFPMTLQLFAEGDGDGAGGGNVSGAGASGEGTNNEPLSFDGFLAQEGNQAEFDRRVQKAIDTAVSNAQQKWQALADDKLSEAEKLAKMNKEEKAAYMQQKKEKELSDRESAVARKELMAEAKNTLAEKKLPAGLAEVLNYTDAETCNKSIAAVEKTFQAAVEAAVQERLKGGEPMKKAPESDADSMEKQVEALIMGRM